MSQSEQEGIDAASEYADSRLKGAQILAQRMYDAHEQDASPSCIMLDCTAALVHEIRALRLTLDALLSEVEL